MSSITHPIVPTAAGRVRGSCVQGVNLFKGIPYGASTAGPNRFLPPRKPQPWSGVRDAFDYGPMAPQEALPPEPRAGEFFHLYQGAFLSGPTSEDCLTLNVWSPELGGVRPRPVMVWLHGGAFARGAASWGWADGVHLARENDVVIVSLNHRLNLFGYLHLADICGARYAESGNAGMLDIVAALAWVRDNIGAFGGDPGNVTLFGHSGGGSKVNVLLAMPAAHGLFHKAISMSGPGRRMITRDAATATAEAVLQRLAIRPERIDRLQQVPARELLQTMKAISDVAHGEWREGSYDYFPVFAPVVDGASLPQHPFDPTAPAISSAVPLLLGTTADETSWVMQSAGDATTDEIVRAKLRQLGLSEAHANSLIRAYRTTRPGAAPAEIFAAIAADLQFRADAIVSAERKAALGKAPAYMYLFTWQSPAFGGKYHSSHMFEVPFVFATIERATGLWDPAPSAIDFELARKMRGAWIAFARTGNPNHHELPQWHPYTAERRATMVLGHVCESVDDVRRADRLAIRQT